MIFAGDVSAADWMMIKCKPSQPCEVAHIYWDNAGVACETDAVGEKIVRPGVKVKCERLPALRLAIQPPVISNTKE